MKRKIQKRWVATGIASTILSTALIFQLTKDDFQPEIVKDEILAEHNHIRNKLTHGSVAWNKELDQFAQNHVEWMAKNNSLKHSSLNLKGFSWLGENIAVGYNDANDVMNGWMNSTGHKRNIENKNYTRIGIGVIQVNNKKWYCTVFGKPSDDNAIPVISQPKPIVKTSEHEAEQ